MTGRELTSQVISDVAGVFKAKYSASPTPYQTGGLTESSGGNLILILVLVIAVVFAVKALR